MRIALRASLMLVALGVCACASSTTTSTVTSRQNPGSSPSTSAPASNPSATTASTTATTSPAQALRCRASQLQLSFLGQQGATGHGEIGFALRNVGATSCRTLGYPGIRFLGHHGRPLPTSPTRTTRDLLGEAPARPLDVAPGTRVSFRVGVTHGINSSAGCTTAYRLQVIAPDDTASVQTTIPQGAYECGTATIIPLQQGNSAYP